MSAELYPLGAITYPARRILGERPNMTDLLDEIEQDPTEMADLLQNVDTVIEAYNSLTADNLPEGLNHLPRIKPVIDQLPTIQSMLANHGSGICRVFIRTLRDMSPLMQRAEERQPEPYIGFHVWENASRTERLVGGIFQAYGMTIVKDALNGDLASKEEEYRVRDSLLDGLIETMVLNQAKHEADAVFDVVNSQGWFQAMDEDGGYLFSDTIRDMASSLS